jgi:hypothetical protein
MKTLCLTITACFFFCLSACNGQSKKEDPAHKPQELVIHDSLYKPKFKANVNRKYDKNGNLIQFDSTYTYSYSGPAHIMSGDSLFRQFRSYFGGSVPGFPDLRSGPGFLGDSLFFKDPFFNDGFFQRPLEFNQRFFDRLFWPLDSLDQGRQKGSHSHTRTL